MGTIAESMTPGNRRVVDPAETWARVRPHLAAMGITRVAEVTGLDVIGIPVFQAVRPNGRTLSVSQGKGVTAELARVSAVMESIEMWHAEEVDLPYVDAVVADIQPQLAYPVFDLPQPPRSALSSGSRLRWTAARSLSGAQGTWLPLACVRMDNTDPSGWSPPLLSSTSNGLASGNTVSEALVHALYELVERDARARVGAGHATPTVDVTTLTGESAALAERFHRAGVRLLVRDLTDLAGLPCYEAVIWSRDLPVRFAGSGCHRYADVALSRALTEAAQSRLTMIAGSRDDLSDEAYAWVDSRPRLRDPFSDCRPDREFVAGAVTTNLLEDLAAVTALVDEKSSGGVYWVDLSHRDFDIPVVRVVAPGLRLSQDYR
ncbi:YcaO-like family protein [Micromonospora auratinigra]|uniref:Ribosomal protein S12 methylthiotransferase accessory factor n=1 Tax=Micromonospora auratinigra TaxID=261654 RepID=A0A1A8Z4P8_9ACTN|nr:YcaO-like family protein [Micromonospora auratinigra]SBT38777.1 ribosomal protein S12 methylthiotransferase accessory factor [Micromonospora auratinigra]